MAKAINKQIIFDGKTTVGTSDRFGCTNATVLKIQVDGTFTGVSISVLGRVTSEMSDKSIAIFKDADVSILSAINIAGTYTCDITGFDSIVIELSAIGTGAVDVCLKAVE